MSDDNASVDDQAEARGPDPNLLSDSPLALVTLTRELEGLKTRVEGLEAQRKKKFYQDQSFWIGITAIPIIFASGWLLKLATDSPLLLLEIHRLLGTEPALVAALDERHNALKDAIQSIGKGRAPVLTALLRVGLMQERAQKLDCSPDTSQPATSQKLHCEIPQDAFLNVADAPFSIGAATKVDVGIVVNVVENVFRDDGYREKVVDKTTELKTTQLIRVAMNGADLELKPMRFSPVLSVGNSQFQFARYSFPCFGFNDPEVPDFPINTLTVSVSNSADHRYSISVGALVQESHQSCTDKK
ncbi:hypothetical protein ACVW16_007017 [Bradyrhizobium sp. USDA 4474]